ncbi:hypothetical protein H1P_1890003 [Hyella patelloides LEGE 07179]|uniref:Uncharacterized protein n=1 Tax=Hyella patelloides LEGE 07179 TaxID=945734 RepID=A0A563VNZ3_9CYAN|nr:hypothetical protein [Hyella patelloides]VEP13188.1 hypothetical protein H1P_1890003 [Hyella patelloides LEGE 07179]
MKPEFNQQQTDWLAETEELDDIEASQVNGGGSPYPSTESLLLDLLNRTDKEIRNSGNRESN